MEIERDYPEHEPTAPFAFGDKVRTELGDEGTIVEVDTVDGLPEYKVVGAVEYGWYPAHELTHAE
jgi:hypothetical protein